MLSEYDEENPFRPGGDLSREVDEVLRNSTISRQAVVIRDPIRSIDSEIGTQSAPASARHSSISNGTSTLRSGRHGKQLHSVHFSPNDPKLYVDDSHFFPNENGEPNSSNKGEIIEGTVYRHYLGSPVLDNNNKNPITNGLKPNSSTPDGCAFSADSVQHVRLKGDEEDETGWVLSSEAIVQTIEETKPLQAERIVIKTQKKRPCCKMM